MLPYCGSTSATRRAATSTGSAPATAVERAREQVAALLGCEPRRDRVHLGRHRGEQPRHPGRGRASPSAPPHRDLRRRAPGHRASRARYLERTASRSRASRWTRGGCASTTSRAVRARRHGARDGDARAERDRHAHADRRDRRLAHERGALMHTDAAQAVGKIPTRVDDLGVDLLSIAGHKLYAPKGVGALYVRRGVSLAPLVLGAGHERGCAPAPRTWLRSSASEERASWRRDLRDGVGAPAPAARRALGDSCAPRSRACVSTAIRQSACRTRSTCPSRACVGAQCSRRAGDRGIDGLGLPRGRRNTVSRPARHGHRCPGRSRRGSPVHRPVNDERARNHGGRSAGTRKRRARVTRPGAEALR